MDRKSDLWKPQTWNLNILNLLTWSWREETKNPLWRSRSTLSSFSLRKRICWPDNNRQLLVRVIKFEGSAPVNLTSSWKAVRHLTLHQSPTPRLIHSVTFCLSFANYLTADCELDQMQNVSELDFKIKILKYLKQIQSLGAKDNFFVNCKFSETSLHWKIFSDPVDLCPQSKTLVKKKN